MSQRKLFDVLGASENKQSQQSDQKEQNFLKQFQEQLLLRDKQYQQLVDAEQKTKAQAMLTQPSLAIQVPPTFIPNTLFTNGKQTAATLAALETQLAEHPDELTQKEIEEFQGYVKSATEILSLFNELNFQDINTGELETLNTKIQTFEQAIAIGKQQSESIISEMQVGQMAEETKKIKAYDSKYRCIQLLSNICYGIGAITATLGLFVATSSLVVGGYGLPMNDPTVIARAPLVLKLAIIGGALVAVGAAFGLLGFGIASLLEKYDPRPVPLNSASLPKMSNEKKSAYDGLKQFAETAKNIHPKK